MNQEPLDLFIDNLLKEANLILPEDFKDQYIEKLKEQVNRRLSMALIDGLDDAGLAEFNQLMSAEPQPDFNTIQAFYSEKIPDLPQKIQSELAGFANDFLTASKK